MLGPAPHLLCLASAFFGVDSSLLGGASWSGLSSAPNGAESLNHDASQAISCVFTVAVLRAGRIGGDPDAAAPGSGMGCQSLFGINRDRTAALIVPNEAHPRLGAVGVLAPRSARGCELPVEFSLGDGE